jgi:hypothetical protein
MHVGSLKIEARRNAIEAVGAFKDGLKHRGDVQNKSEAG